MDLNKFSKFKKFSHYLILLFLSVSSWGCSKENNSEESQVFTHQCKLQKCALNFNDFTGLDCTVPLSEFCHHKYLYNENNLVFKRVKILSGAQRDFQIDSIAFDEIGRVVAEYYYERDSLGPKSLEIVRQYFFNNDTDIYPVNSERYWVNGNANINTEEYIFESGKIIELKLIKDGTLEKTESFEYNFEGNLKQKVIDYYNNDFTDTISYSNYDDMINPIREFPFRDLFGVRNSKNNYREINAFRELPNGELTTGYGFSVGSFIYNDMGYPIIGFMEYDCN